MTRGRLPEVAAAALLCGAGCTHITSSVHTDPKLSGELWYVKTTTVFSLPVATSIWYCPDVTQPSARCTQAVMSDEAGAAPATVIAPQPTVEAPTSIEPHSSAAFWNVASSGAEGDDLCGGVASLLAKDEACTAEQCRAPLALSAIFLTKCRDDADAAAAVRKLREAWRKQAPGDSTDCSKALFRVGKAKTAEKAKNYTTACLASREPSSVEKAILEAVK